MIDMAFLGFSGTPVPTERGVSSATIGVVVSVITYGLAGYFFVKALYVTLNSHAEYLAFLQAQYTADFIEEANSTANPESM